MTRLGIYIFSFNRGKYLENLINSIEKNFSGYDVIIVDDKSDDLKTIELLHHYSTKYRVVISDTIKNAPRGGLYQNFQYAIEDARERGYEYAQFLSEDLQFVRKVTEQDLNRAKCFFETVPNSFQIGSLFIERVYEQVGWNSGKLKLITPCNYYVRGNAIPQKRMQYSDQGLFHVERFFKMFHTFEHNERLCEIKAIERGIVNGYDATPLFAFLPYQEYSRKDENENKLANLICEISGAGFYPYNYMQSSEVDALFSRDLSELPYAEDWLSCPTLNKNESGIWSFWGGLFHLESHNDERKTLAARLHHIKSETPNREQRVNKMIKECEKYINDTSFFYN